MRFVAHLHHRTRFQVWARRSTRAKEKRVLWCPALVPLGLPDRCNGNFGAWVDRERVPTNFATDHEREDRQVTVRPRSLCPTEACTADHNTANIEHIRICHEKAWTVPETFQRERLASTENVLAARCCSHRVQQPKFFVKNSRSSGVLLRPTTVHAHPQNMGTLQPRL